MNNPEDARAEIGVMMSAYADVLHGTREARELTRFQPDMLVNLDVFQRSAHGSPAAAAPTRSSDAPSDRARTPS